MEPPRQHRFLDFPLKNRALFVVIKLSKSFAKKLRSVLLAEVAQLLLFFLKVFGKLLPALLDSLESSFILHLGQKSVKVDVSQAVLEALFLEVASYSGDPSPLPVVVLLDGIEQPPQFEGLKTARGKLA